MTAAAMHTRLAPPRHKVIRQQGVFEGVMRAKGCFWTMAEPDTRVDYSLVGQTASLIVSSAWAQVGLDMLTREDVHENWVGSDRADADQALGRAVQRLTANADRLKSQGVWHPATHDRRVDLVFIGDVEKMDEERMRGEIEAALLTQDELRDFLQAFGSPARQTGRPLEDVANPFANIPRCMMI